MATTSVANFRDVGGMASSVMSSSGGRQEVRTGMLFRSARVDHAVPEDVKHLRESLGIKCVLDLRSDAEAARSLRRNGSNAQVNLERSKTHEAFPVKEHHYMGTEPRTTRIDLAGLALLWTSPYWVRIVGFFFLITGQKSRASRFFMERVVNVGGLKRLYVAFLQYRQREIAQSLWLLMDPSSLPALVHCMQGKDRTGVVVALFLHMLGCSRADIIMDFVRSDSGLEPEMAYMRSSMNEVGMADEFARAPADALEQAFKWLEETYGSVDAYLKYIGITDEDVQVARSIYLVPSA